MPVARVVVYHKQKTSARLRFLIFDGAFAAGPEPMGEDAIVDLENDDAPEPKQVEILPSVLVAPLAERLGLLSAHLRAEVPPLAEVTTPAGKVEVFAICCDTEDPPFDEAASIGAAFKELTEARGLPRTELELMRRVYKRHLG